MLSVEDRVSDQPRDVVVLDSVEDMRPVAPSSHQSGHL